MKKIMMLLVVAGMFAINPVSLFAQYTQPGDPGTDPEVAGDPPLGGGAPVGGGMFILLSLGAVYGGKKLYRLFDEENLEENENQIIN